MGERKDQVGVKGCGCGLLSGRGLRCPRRTRASGLEARMGEGRSRDSPGAGGVHGRPREVKLAQGLLTHTSSVIPGERSPCKGMKDRVRE